MPHSQQTSRLHREGKVIEQIDHGKNLNNLIDHQMQQTSTNQEACHSFIPQPFARFNTADNQSPFDYLSTIQQFRSSKTQRKNRINIPWIQTIDDSKTHYTRLQTANTLQSQIQNKRKVEGLPFFATNFTPRPSGISPLSAAGGFLWEKSINQIKPVKPNPTVTYLGHKISKQQILKPSKSPKVKKTNLRNYIQIIQTTELEANKQQSQFLKELQRWKDARENQLRQIFQEQSLKSKSKQNQQSNDQLFDGSQKDEKDEKHRVHKKKDKIQVPPLPTRSQPLQSNKTNDSLPQTDKKQITPIIQQELKLTLIQQESALSNTSGQTLNININPNITQKRTPDTIQLKKYQTLTPVATNNKFNQHLVIKKNEQNLDWGKISQASNVSQITHKDQKIEKNLLIDSQKPKELYTSQVTEKTIELTPAFQKSETQVKQNSYPDSNYDQDLRIRKVAERIESLSLHLDQFKQEIDQQMGDPILQSTGRTGERGQPSQQSRRSQNASLMSVGSPQQDV